jgi:type IV pilus assembly protein PilX
MSRLLKTDLVKIKTPKTHDLLRTQVMPVLAQQQGVALVVVLMMTLVIAALSVSLAMGVFGEHKLSRNAADVAIARQAAEAALRDAEHDLTCERWSTVKQDFVRINTGVDALDPNYADSAVKNPDATRPWCNGAKVERAEQMGTSNEPNNQCKNGLFKVSGSDGVDVMAAKNFVYLKDAANGGCNIAFGTVTGQGKYDLLGLGTTPYTQPIYTIEEFSNSNVGKGTVRSYRITARGYGRSANTVVDVQSVFRPFAQ